MMAPDVLILGGILCDTGSYENEQRKNAPETSVLSASVDHSD